MKPLVSRAFDLLLKRKAKLAYKLFEYYWPEDYLPWIPPKPYKVLVPGAEKCCDIGGPAPDAFSGVYSIPNSYGCINIPNRCGSSGNGREMSWNGEGNLPGDPTYRTMRMFYLGWATDPSPEVGRMTYKEQWVLPYTGVPYPEIPFQPETAPLYMPSPLPTFTPFPEDLPIQAPAPFPLPVPYPLVPYLPDSPWPQGRITDQPRTERPGYAGPRVDPNAGPSVEVGPGGSTKGPPHSLEKPGKGTKERKKALAPINDALKDAIDKVLGPATELDDLIDALVDALPRGTCRGAKSPQAKADCLYRNADKIDLDQALKNILLNQIEDAVIGKIGQKVKQQGGKRPTGLQGIGWGAGPAL